MAEVFISYARKDKGFVRDLHAALQKANRDSWIDWRSIPDSAEWRAEIFAAIEASDNFLFIISPDSLRSPMCDLEVAHAFANKKRVITILYRSVDRQPSFKGLGEIQWIDYSELGFEQSFQRLIAAIDTDLEWVRQHTRFGLRASKWVASGRDDGFLLRGTELREAIRWLGQATTVKNRQPTKDHEQYIRASQEWEVGELDRRAKIFRRVCFAVGGFLLVAVVAAIGAYWQRSLAHGRELVSASIASQDTDPELSVLIGAESVAVTWPWGHTALQEAQEQLRRAILTSHVRLTLRGHTDRVYSVAWSPDGKRLATASEDKTLKVWDATSGKEVLTLSGYTGGVYSVAWSPDGERVAVGSPGQTAKVWPAAPIRELLTLSCGSVAWSPKGKRVAGSEGKTAKVWDAASGHEVLTLRGHTGGVYSVAWSPDGKRLATASEDKTLKVWDATSGKEVLTLRGSVSNVAWSPDGKRLATGNWDGTARVWDAASGHEVLTLRGHTGAVYSVAWSPDGKQVATGSYDDTAKVWDVADGQEVLTLRGHTDRVYSVAWSPDGMRLATASWDHTAKVWDAASGQEVLTLRGHRDRVRSVAWSPDGKRLATGSDDHTAKVWDAASGKELLTLRGHSGRVYSVAWSPDGKRLATGSEDETAKVWNVDTGEELLTLRGRNDSAARKEKEAKDWNEDFPNLKIKPYAHNSVLSVAWSPDGKRLATGSEDETAKGWVWLADGVYEHVIMRGQGSEVNNVAWSPDGNRVATASGGTPRVFKGSGGGELLTMPGHNDLVRSVAWSPDGKRLATGSDDHTAKVWDAASGQEVLTLRGHKEQVRSVAWSPDGKRLATASDDGTAKLWDTASGQELLTLRGHAGAVNSVAWSPDGKRLATASDDQTVRTVQTIYSMAIGDLMALARERYIGGPSDENCQKYLHADKCPPFPELPWW